MGAYRLYFLDRKGAIEAHQDFIADSDTEAKTTGSMLWRSCADCFQGYELWEGQRRLAREGGNHTPVSPPPIDGIAPHLQKRLLALQEILLGSHWRAVQSVALIASTEALRRSIGGSNTAAITHHDMLRYIGATTGSGMVSLQMVHGSELRLSGSRGFDRFFDEYFAVVDCDDCACGAAFTNRCQTIVPAPRPFMPAGNRSTCCARRASRPASRRRSSAATAESPACSRSCGGTSGIRWRANWRSFNTSPAISRPPWQTRFPPQRGACAWRYNASLLLIRPSSHSVRACRKELSAPTLSSRIPRPARRGGTR